MKTFSRGAKPGRSKGGDNKFKSSRPSSGGRRDFGRPSSGRSFDGPRSTESFKAVCSQCKSDCRVPFKPTSGKPVLCNDCFGKNTAASKRETGKSFGGRSFEGRHESSSFDRSPRSFRDEAPRSASQFSPNQFEMLSDKLDQVLAALQALQPNSSEIEVRTVTKKRAVRKSQDSDEE